MSSEFRYHIASLAAVFLALGIGIFVGTAFVGAPVVDRQTRLIKHLEQNVAAQGKDAAEREKNEEALRALLPSIVHNKLTGRRVLVVQTGAFSKTADEVAEALRLAGADTVGRVVLPAPAWRTEGGSTNDDDAAQIAQAEHLAAVLLAPSENGLRLFRDRGLISGEADLTGSGPFRFIVLVGGGSVQNAEANAPGEPWPLVLARKRDVPLIAALQNANGAVVVGCEPLTSDVSFMPAYQAAGICTIDAVDRAVGQMALPFVLNGEKGNYGLKSTADRVLPASLTTPPPLLPAPTATPAPAP